MEQATLKADSIENHFPAIGELKRFLTIAETAEVTGLSTFFIRQGIKQGWIPFIRCGNKAMINIRKLIDVLDEQSVNCNCR